jgi:hypothetical protein
MPADGRTLTAEEVAPPLVAPAVAAEAIVVPPVAAPGSIVPASVRNMSVVLERASARFARNILLIRLAERRYPAGLRLRPTKDAETTSTAEWVGDRLDNPSKAGVHRPKNWAAFHTLINRAGEDGMVLTLPEPGREPTVFMKAANQIWEIRADPQGIHAEPWTAPTAWLEKPPRMALAFNKCADFLT